MLYMKPRLAGTLNRLNVDPSRRTVSIEGPTTNGGENFEG
jgi:hypothetical protein